MGKSIGILGGMGPLATADLFKKIVLSTKADSDNGHIRVFIDNNPAVPDRTAAILGHGPDPLPEMRKALGNLIKCGADCIVMPCNTAHNFLPQLTEGVDIPFISILESTAKACARRFPGQTAALLGTWGTYATGIYDGPLKGEGVAFIVPEDGEKETLMKAIYGLKGGNDLSPMKTGLETVLERLRGRGADYFILGCTELPLIADMLFLAGPFVDPTQEQAEAAIRFCGYEVVK